MPLLLTVRALTLSIVILLIDYFWPLGTSPIALALACALGVLAGGFGARSRLKTLGFLICVGGLLACSFLVSKAAEAFAVSLFSDPLLFYAGELHASLALVSFLIGAVSTWIVIRSVHGLSIEVALIIAGALSFFSGHRDFNFQSPQILGSISWSLGYSPLAVLTALGVTLLALTLFYLRLCGGLHEQRLNLTQHKGQSSAQTRTKSVLSTLCICALFLIIGNSIFSRYRVEAEERTSNGVGQGKEENQSPLGFNSALGASNQPSALVRLDSDYSNNPFVPMLYLRETALSKFNGREMVAADSRFDRETATIPPDGHFKSTEPPAWEYRTPLVQSVYLLSDHKLAFAVDYPVSINPLKNPNPGRFRGAYKVYSMAPGFSKESLRALPVGDPNWDEETRSYYLETNSDGRYAELAKKITADIPQPIEKALALTAYLSEHAIYTLSPGHDVPENGDQTAPFLFGDMRGYCVHFAHALVYLFRSLGIPARVGTGYLTDLSEARDGHILLRMSDRHAWAEVYIQDRGWIPFDPKPQHVESHAESPVDMKLLEELMGLVGPDEEILPPDLTQGEAGVVEPNRFTLPGRQYVLIPLFVLLLSFTFIKLHLWFSWALPGSQTFKLRRLYRALVARINDFGISREEGETREEYRMRASEELGLDLLSLTSPFNRMTYAGKTANNGLLEMYRRDIQTLSNVSFLQRLKAGLSPASVLRYCSRSGW